LGRGKGLLDVWWYLVWINFYEWKGSPKPASLIFYYLIRRAFKYEQNPKARNGIIKLFYEKK